MPTFSANKFFNRKHNEINLFVEFLYMITNAKNQFPRKKQMRILMVLIFSLFALTAVVQNNAQTRSITSEDFVKRRPASKSNKPVKSAIKNPPKTGKNTNSPKRPATYISVPKAKSVRRTNSKDSTVAVSKTQKSTRAKASKKPESATAAAIKKPNKTVKIQNTPEELLEIGVTVWKLRPPRLSDEGIKIPVRNADGRREMWTAERVVDSDKPFQAGERVRLAVESSFSGYLYVINSEVYSDDTLGEPFLIFPSSANENNRVQPGLLVDIPDQTEDLPYFVINPKNPKYAGEFLTVIISPQPLTNLKTDSDGKIISLNNLTDLEKNADAEIFARTDNQDKIYTQAEADAACGAKARGQNSRQLERPCGANTRQLTREEPLPQTIYRVKTTAGQPAVTFIRLNVRN